jgi:hypothetical protein
MTVGGGIREGMARCPRIQVEPWRVIFAWEQLRVGDEGVLRYLQEMKEGSDMGVETQPKTHMMGSNDVKSG